MATVRRVLGPLAAAGIGVSAMLGAGVFWVWGPVLERAGSLFVVAIVLAGFLSLLNALSVAQLALLVPESGGVYAYARRYLSPGAGFFAGWLFLIGKLSSAAAIAVIAATYALPDHAQWVAPVLVAVFALINITGIRSTAAVALVVTTLVVAVLLGVIFSAASAPSVLPVTLSTDAYSLWQAAGLMFFAFAGYARMATLGAEVKNPATVLPRVIVGTLVAVIALYVAVGVSVVRALGASDVVASAAPLADAAGDSWRGLVVIAAVLACLGSLGALLAGLSRTAMAMSQSSDLPQGLAVVSVRTGSPMRAEVAMAALAIVAAAVLDPLWLVGLSSATVLSYYAIGHLSVLRVPRQDRRLPVVVAWLGLAGCVSLVFALPAISLLAGAGALTLGAVVWWGLHQRRRHAG